MSVVNINIPMIYWAFIFKAIEYVASIITFRLFIFEEICQSGNIQLYINTRTVKTKPTSFILQKIYEHAYDPAMFTLEWHGWLCPWAMEVFGIYFHCEKKYLELYAGEP